MIADLVELGRGAGLRKAAAPPRGPPLRFRDGERDVSAFDFAGIEPETREIFASLL